jgi:hypothetical protein
LAILAVVTANVALPTIPAVIVPDCAARLTVPEEVVELDPPPAGLEHPMSAMKNRAKRAIPSSL